MHDMRRWQLEATSPYVLQLAADARLTQTSFTNDQIWELVLGTGDDPALALQTRYGGRVKQVSLVPMWTLGSQVVYQPQTYATPPRITAFAPGYAQVQANLTTELELVADYWVMESSAVGARYMLSNSGDESKTLRLDVFGHVIAEKRVAPPAILTLIDDTYALSLGRMTGLEPVVVLENGQVELPLRVKTSPKIGANLTILAGETVQVRWVHAGSATMSESLDHAQFWLSHEWDSSLEHIETNTQLIPVVETGNADYDAVIAFSYQQLMQAFLDASGNLPHASYVASRDSHHGFSSRGDGSDYGRGWNGQTPHLSYLVALAIAPVKPDLAEGIIRNYLAIQGENGWIDFNATFSGQQRDILCPPLLARLTWEVYRYTNNRDLLKDTFPALMDFFNRWSEYDLDKDGDILPEWQDERQTGYVFWPTFGMGQPWSQNLNIACAETPDATAYMLSEAISLQKIAQELENPGAHELQQRITELQSHMARCWYESESRYAYRDRDTHAITPPITIIEDAHADQEQLPALKLDPPSRIVVRVSGGTGKVPQASLYIEGVDKNGTTIEETVDLEEFVWSYGHGVYSSQKVYALIDRVRFEGLSRVYRIHARTVDTTRLDINAVLPIWSTGIPEDKAEAIQNLVTDEEHFWRTSGLTIVSAQDTDFDPSSANGGGGIWSYWTTLVGEGLLHYGHGEVAAKLIRRLIETQAKALAADKHFGEFYHSDEPKGLGERGYLSGIAPLHLLMQVLGMQIIDGGRVRIFGPCFWESPITIKQFSVTVERSANGTVIQFASGYEVELSADADEQLVTDPDPTQTTAPEYTAPVRPEPEQGGPTLIELEQEETDE